MNTNESKIRILEEFSRIISLILNRNYVNL